MYSAVGHFPRPTRRCPGTGTNSGDWSQGPVPGLPIRPGALWWRRLHPGPLDAQPKSPEQRTGDRGTRLWVAAAGLPRAPKCSLCHQVGLPAARPGWGETLLSLPQGCCCPALCPRTVWIEHLPCPLPQVRKSCRMPEIVQSPSQHNQLHKHCTMTYFFFK